MFSVALSTIVRKQQTQHGYFTLTDEPEVQVNQQVQDQQPHKLVSEMFLPDLGSTLKHQSKLA